MTEETDQEFVKEEFSDDEIAVGTNAVREKIDATGYGTWVSEEQCKEVARAVLEAVAELRNG